MMDRAPYAPIGELAVMRWSMLLCSVVTSTCLLAQEGDGPSVAELKKAARSSDLPVAERLDAYEQLGWDHYLATATDSAVLVSEVMLALADSAEFHADAVSALRLKAVALSEKGDLEGAIAEVQRALERCERHGLDDLLPKVYTSLGIFHNQIGDLGQAMSYHSRTMQAYEKAGDGAGMAAALNNLGFVHYDARDTVQALASFKRSVAIRDSLGIGHMNLNALGNIGGMYMDREEPREALPYLEKALAIAEGTGDRRGQARALSNMGTCYKQLGELRIAMDHLRKSNDLAVELNMPGVEAVNLLVMAEVALAQGARGEALAMALRSHALTRAIGDVYIRENAAMRLYELYKEAGDLRQALSFHEEGVQLRDSLANDRSRNEVMRQQAQYEFEKRDALRQAEQEKKDAVAAEELRRRNLQRNAFIGGFVLMLALAGTFLFQRNRINKERRRSEELLLNILPEEVAEELKEKGEADARHFDTATILFTDFKGFTQLSEKVTPAELVAELNTCFKAFDGIMGKYRIEKIKTIGDAYMAAGGLPDPKHGSPADVVRAALEMQEFMQQHKAEREAAGKPYFEMRAGIHTGPVVAGIVGVKKFQYDIWGDTVNTASRMESSGEVGKVNISEATYDLVKNEPGIIFTPRGKVEAKGKGGLDMYFVEGQPAIA